MNSLDNIVISGIAGRFPECANIEEFKEALLKGTDMLTVDSRRYTPGALKTPERLGKIPEVDKFDAAFFGIHAKQADFMDPRQRILNETVYECIIDAGINPQELRGTKTGVYVGIGSFTSTEQMREHQADGYTNIGICLAMAANRASYCFDFKGPSYALDTACSSTLYAFVNAIKDLKSGDTDNAIVCGAQLNFHPYDTSEFNKLNMLSKDGKCKVFSTKRDGYVRSEAIISLLLQKESNTRRIYATVLGGKTNADGNKLEGITFPSSKLQLELMRDIYNEAKINLNDVTYVEAHGTGTPIGDIQECQSIVNMFCKNRRSPLPMGAVKSNMGHSECCSGLCSVAKVIVAMESGIIPANKHVEPLDTELPGINDGKLKVVTKNLPWNGGVVAVNCFGFGGANAHIALKSYPKEKTKNYKRPKYRLVQASGRTEEAVNHFLDEIQANQDDEEFLALVDEIHKMNIEGHNYRGYTILRNKPKREVARYNKDRPIWFIYTGMGSQWANMGRDLMKFEVFRNSFRRCAIALKPYSIDLEDILTNSTSTTFDNITNCFCSIAAISISLTDMLFSLGVVPNGFAGHSLGEVGCAYADGQITLEQAVLLAYARGYASENTKLPAGQMAAVGLSKEECQKLLPEDIYIACQNGKGSVTISGPDESTKAFVEKLNSKSIFAKLVNSAGFAFHTKYITDAGPLLLDFLKNILKEPKPRSAKWISSSVPENKVNESWAKYNCAEYHHNNFCSTVLFDQVYQHIPKNAIVIELGPHGLLQAILKRELNSNNTNISLIDRSSDDNEEFFLSSLGKIYMAGGHINLRNLYNGVKFPVSRGTKMLSPLVKWDHSTTWFVPYWKVADSFGETVTVNISDEKYSYLDGHNIDGRVLMPATGYLELVWKVCAKMHMKGMEDLPIVLENIKFKRATVLPRNTDVKFLINIMKKSGYFEIFEGGSVVTTGRIWVPKDITNEFTYPEQPFLPKNNYLPLKTNDVYKECHLRRYMYKGLFEGIKECDVYGLYGKAEWKGNFTSFLDTVLHLTLIAETSRDLLLPTSIQQLVIDPAEHFRQVNQNNELEIFSNQDLNIVKSGGIEIIGLESSKAPLRQQTQEDPVLETYEFISFESSTKNQYNFDISLQVALQIVLQNMEGLIKSPKICEIISKTEEAKLSIQVKGILDRQAMVDAEYYTLDLKHHNNRYDAILVTENVVDLVNKDVITANLSETGFVLYTGDFVKVEKLALQIIYQAVFSENSIYLLRPYCDFPNNYAVVNVKNNGFGWLKEIKKLVENNDKKTVYVYNQGDEVSGIIGLMKCILTEPKGVTFKSIFIQDKNADMFSIHNEFYRDQLKKNLTFNVLKKGSWGTFVHLPLKEIENRLVENASVSILTTGDLSTLKWIQRPSRIVKSDAKSELVHVFYSALNFKDIMIATGKLQSSQGKVPTALEINIGLEYAGITSSGKRVMGLLGCESLSLQVQTDPGFTWEVPETWSLEDAATVPCVYATCYYAMIIRGQMKSGESILIHAGSGGIGLAAISIALSMGCMVFTTAGSQEKRDYLKQTFPQLKDENIGNSRNKSFEKMIMKMTKGKGVDLVLNSLSSELFQASLRCVADQGRFLEIGKVDFFAGTPIDSKMFLKNCSFHGILLDKLFDSYSITKQSIKYLFNEGIKNGVVRPLPRVVFKEDEVESAFRFLSSGKHKGKVLIELRKENPDLLNSSVRSITAVPKVYFDPVKSYILIGGLGGVGLELTDWMIRRGATKIILNSKGDISNGYQSYCFRKWSQFSNVVVETSKDDTTSLEGAQKLILAAQQLGPVGGIFNMALVLRDALIENQSRENFEAVFKPKIISGQNMDSVTRRHCSALDYFVVFSSVACGRGNSGQANYGMANSALERLCENRKKNKLPALAVQWGPIRDVGALVKTGIQDRVFDQMLPQNINSCLNTLEKFMLQSSAVGSSVVLSSKNSVTNTGPLKSPAEAVAHILGIRNIDNVDKTITLSQLGLDSLMVAEIKQTLYRKYQVELNTDEIRDLTFNSLLKMGNCDGNTCPTVVPNGVNGNSRDSVNAIIPKQTVIKLNNSELSKKIVFLVHPIEGHIEVLNILAKQLKAVVYGLQCTKDADYDSLQTYASYFIKHIKDTQPKGPYFLCGYSYGGALAFEMGLQMEKEGETVYIVSIDGSPVYVKNTLKDGFVRLGESVEDSKMAILSSFASIFTGVNQENIKELLETTVGWEKQLQAVSDTISRETGIDSAEILLSADRFYKRCHAGYFYEPTNILKGKVLLIRQEDNPFILSDDYDLQKMCQQKVEVLKLKGDHRTILLGDNTTNISEKINKILL